MSPTPDPRERAVARRRAAVLRSEYDVGEFIEMTTPEFVRPTPLQPVAEAFDDAMRGPVFALIEAPPRHGKSELAFHHMARRFKYRPGTRMAYATYAASFATRKSRRIRELTAKAGTRVGRARTLDEPFEASYEVY